MSLWIHRWRCRQCGSEMNIQGGVVGTTHMGPNGPVPCPNHNCESMWGNGSTIRVVDGISYVDDNGFENIGPMDINNPEHSQFLIRHLNSGNGD